MLTIEMFGANVRAALQSQRWGGALGLFQCKQLETDIVACYAEAVALLPRLTDDDREKMRPYVESIKSDPAKLSAAVSRMTEKAEANDETTAALAAAANSGV